MNKEELKKIYEKEQEYKDIFEAFINSKDEQTFSKTEVKKIIEAHLFREYSYQGKTKANKKNKNLFVTTRKVGARIFNIKAILSMIITYIFYIGFLILINEFVFPGVFYYKWTIFIISIGLTIVDKLIKPLLFIADLITFTFHKIGFVTLFIFTILIYFISYFLGEKVALEKTVVIAILLLFGMAFIEFLKRDSILKTKYIDDLDFDDGEDDDEY